MVVDMANSDLQAGWSYHNAIKHSYRSVRSNPNFLDWANRPQLYWPKPVPGLRIPLSAKS